MHRDDQQAGAQPSADFNPAMQLEALAREHGVTVTDAIRHAGENTATFRRWRRELPATAQVFNRIRRAILELAEARKQQGS